jgi:hypothetical protein
MLPNYTFVCFALGQNVWCHIVCNIYLIRQLYMLPNYTFVCFALVQNVWCHIVCNIYLIRQLPRILHFCAFAIVSHCYTCDTRLICHTCYKYHVHVSLVIKCVMEDL